MPNRATLPQHPPIQTPETAPLDLPFDADTMLAGLRTWVECESPTFDAAAVNRMMAIAAREFAVAVAVVETIPGRMGHLV